MQFSKQPSLWKWTPPQSRKAHAKKVGLEKDKGYTRSLQNIWAHPDITACPSHPASDKAGTPSLPDTTAKSSSPLLPSPDPLLTPSLIAILLISMPPSIAPRKCCCWNHFKGKFPSDFTLHQACKAARREFKSSALFPPKPMNMLWIQLISGIKASFSQRRQNQSSVAVV